MSPVSPVFHAVLTVSIGLKNELRMGTSIPQVKDYIVPDRNLDHELNYGPFTDLFNHFNTGLVRNSDLHYKKRTTCILPVILNSPGFKTGHVRLSNRDSIFVSFSRGDLK